MIFAQELYQKNFTKNVQSEISLDSTVHDFSLNSSSIGKEGILIIH